MQQKIYRLDFYIKVRLKWRGKSSPQIWQHIWQCKPHKEQDHIEVSVVYLLNNLVNNIYDMDLYRKSVDLIDVSLQKMGGSKNILFCMGGRLFKGNSLIKGAKVFNWKQETPEVN